MKLTTSDLHDILLPYQSGEISFGVTKNKINELIEECLEQEFLRGAEVGDATAVRVRHENDVLLKLLYGKINIMEAALRQIRSEKSCVESQSTGMKQYFETQGAQIARKTLEEIK